MHGGHHHRPSVDDHPKGGGQPGAQHRIQRLRPARPRCGSRRRRVVRWPAAGASRQPVYLHFGDRARPLLALLAWVDQAFKLDNLLARVNEAPTGVEALERMVKAARAYSPRIDALVHVLEAHQYQDPAVPAALRNRLEFRRAAHRAVIARIAAEPDLAKGRTLDTAADLFFA
jgi:AcrR family transcriptional regulator